MASYPSNIRGMNCLLADTETSLEQSHDFEENATHTSCKYAASLSHSQVGMLVVPLRYGWVDRGSMESEGCLTYLHFTASYGKKYSHYHT